MNDFTPKQRDQWVNQEFAKVTRDNAAARLAGERRMVEFAKANGGQINYPESLRAHEMLAERIVATFPEVN